MTFSRRFLLQLFAAGAGAALLPRTASPASSAQGPELRWGDDPDGVGFHGFLFHDGMRWLLEGGDLRRQDFLLWMQAEDELADIGRDFAAARHSDMENLRRVGDTLPLELGSVGRPDVTQGIVLGDGRFAFSGIPSGTRLTGFGVSRDLEGDPAPFLFCRFPELLEANGGDIVLQWEAGAPLFVSR